MDYDLQKRLCTARLVQIFNNKSRAEAWMKMPLKEFDDHTGWYSANELIDLGRYEEVLAQITRIEWNVY